MELSNEVVGIPHSKKSNQSEVAYRLAWSRTYLKKYGLLHNSSRGVWAFAKDPDNIAIVDEREVVRRVRDLFYQDKSDPKILMQKSLSKR